MMMAPPKGSGTAGERDAWEGSAPGPARPCEGEGTDQVREANVKTGIILIPKPTEHDGLLLRSV